jgi:GAF domain-containing protein
MEFREEIGAEALEVKVAELLVATADESDHLIDGSVAEVLKLIRERMKMDVVFVSEFCDGRRVFRAIDHAPGDPAIAEGGSDPLEETWCQRIVDGRLPDIVRDGPAAVAAGRAPRMTFPIGTYVGAPIVLPDGEVYGTLCCFSFGENPSVTQRDAKTLRYTAQLTAQKIDKARRRKAALS